MEARYHAYRNMSDLHTATDRRGVFGPRQACGAAFGKAANRHLQVPTSQARVEHVGASLSKAAPLSHARF